MKIAIILSGGMDSGVLLSDLYKTKSEIYAITFQYGSNHNKKELQCAKILCIEYRVKKHIIIDLPFIKKYFKSSLLSGANSVPEGHYAAENMKSTVVPFRNGIMLSVAAGIAENYDCEELYIGNHAGDHFIYPDCRPAFINGIQDAIYHGTFKQIRLRSPYCHLTKRQIGLKGQKNKFDFTKSWSCYKGKKIHCGKCGACTERKEALNEFDKTKYK